jgi:hypothetical protein
MQAGHSLASMLVMVAILGMWRWPAAVDKQDNTDMRVKRGA